jgi:SAM-dependent methyltransferase
MDWTGLAAQAWDPSGGNDWNFDYPFIGKAIAQYGQPALDVGCGTGRLLLRLLKDGYDVDGIDTSADMLAICREKARQDGLAPNVYQQSMQALDLARRYKVIFIPCGSFVLVTDRAEAWEALRRFHAQLEPQGVLIFNLFWPFKPGEPLSEKPHGGDGDWAPLWSHDLPDGRTIAQQLKRETIDRVDQLLIAQRRYQLIENGNVVQEEIFASNERWYFKHEMLLMLERVGFRTTNVYDGWSDEPFAERHDSMVFVAQK